MCKSSVDSLMRIYWPLFQESRELNFGTNTLCVLFLVCFVGSFSDSNVANIGKAHPWLKADIRVLRTHALWRSGKIGNALTWELRTWWWVQWWPGCRLLALGGSRAASSHGIRQIHSLLGLALRARPGHSQEGLAHQGNIYFHILLHIVYAYISYRVFFVTGTPLKS